MKALRAVPVLVLALAACTAPGPQDSSATATATAAGTTISPASTPSSTAAPTPPPGTSYRLSTVSGAEISFVLPAPPADPAVAAVDAYRVKAGAGPVAYIVADVDNTKGAAPVDMYAVVVTPDEGQQVVFSRVTNAIQAWGPTFSYDFKWTMGDGSPVDEATGQSLKREATALYDANTGIADVGGRATIVLASTQAALPATIARVTVQPSGMGGGEEARPVR
jgi:hypothetical protein